MDIIFNWSPCFYLSPSIIVREVLWKWKSHHHATFSAHTLKASHLIAQAHACSIPAERPRSSTEPSLHDAYGFCICITSKHSFSLGTSPQRGWKSTILPSKFHRLGPNFWRCVGYNPILLNITIWQFYGVCHNQASPVILIVHTIV